MGVEIEEVIVVKLGCLGMADEVTETYTIRLNSDGDFLDMVTRASSDGDAAVERAIERFGPLWGKYLDQKYNVGQDSE